MTQELTRHMNDLRKEVDADLLVFMQDQVKKAGKLDASFKRLVGDTAKQIIRGGKRIRPFYSWLGYRAASGNDQEAIRKLNLAIELYHNFLCIHDDVMDHDDRRHGSLNVIGLSQKRLAKLKSSPNTENAAKALGILSGDLLYSYANQIISELMISQDTKQRLQTRLSDLTLEAAAGQQLDLIMAQDDKLELKKIIKAYHLKTATSTVIAPLQMGAILAGANDKILSVLCQYGRFVGIAYQLTDDVLGMFGSAKQIGKPVLSDLREGKKTALIFYGFKFASEVESKVIRTRLGSANITMSDLKLVRNILNQSGAKAKTLFLAQRYVDEAKKAIRSIEFPSGTKQMLEEMADYVAARDK